MSAQHKHWWTEFREWRQSRRQPTPQLTTPWQRIPNGCPEHPETSMQKVIGPDGLPAWKCPRCGTDAMKPVQVVDKPSPLRPRGARREFLTALGMKPLPPKPALLQTHPDLPKLPPPSPHADVLYTLPPTRHDLPRMPPEVKREVYSDLGTVPKKPAPVQEDRMPGWGTPGWINSDPNIASFREWVEPARADLFADVRQPSRPLEDDEPTVEHERTKRNRMFNQAITGLLGKDEIA